MVALVGVQTNQMIRATDLALRFRQRGLAVLLGGFHVSGSVAMLPERPSTVRPSVPQRYSPADRAD